MISLERILSSRSPALWAGVIVPPLAWAAHLALGDLIYELGCGPAVGGRFLLLTLHSWALIQTIAFLGITLGAGVLSLRAWTRLRARSDGKVWERAYAFALAGMASSLLYGGIIAFGILSPFFLDQCRPPL